MSTPVRRPWFLAPLFALALLASPAMSGGGGPHVVPCGPRTLDDLQRLDASQLYALYTGADLGTPLVGVAQGRVIYLNDRAPKLKVRLANVVWRGKLACADGAFVNRWIGGVRAVSSHYVIGPSWIDGRPCIVMEYAPGTALLANVRDELREVAPGLYLGPIFERFPCPKFRGYVAVQVEPCKPPRWGWR